MIILNRIVYNLKGQHYTARVYAEKNENQGKGTFEYLIVEIPSIREVIAVQDNRPVISKDVLRQRVAYKLNEKGAVYSLNKNQVLFGKENCKFTQKQKEELGDFVHLIKFIDCEQQQEKCEYFNIKQYPTWLINNRTIAGAFTVDELKSLTGL